MDDDGLRLPGCFDGTIPWAGFDRAKVWKEKGSQLWLWFAEDFTPPTSKRIDNIVRNNRAMDRADLCLQMSMADRGFDELVNAVRARSPRLFD